MEDMIERAAKAIYEHNVFGRGQGIPIEKKPAWVDGGNSFMQDTSRAYARAALEAALVYTDGIDFLERESMDLRCFNIPTGGDDYDIEWRVVSHWEAEPNERVEGVGKTPREAIDAAKSALGIA